MEGTLEEGAQDLLALVGERLIDDEISEATRELRVASAEYDSASARFDAAANELKRLLEARLASG